MVSEFKFGELSMKSIISNKLFSSRSASSSSIELRKNNSKAVILCKMKRSFILIEAKGIPKEIMIIEEYKVQIAFS